MLYISNLKLIVMNNGLVRGLITLVKGILLIVMSGSAMELLIRLAGIAFFLLAGKVISPEKLPVATS